MRITSKIMQNNSISNINTNKTLLDRLNTQMTTQSKIIRPSDDPVVAIRALRLRTNLSEISQYYEKNIPDARSWLSVTEDALGNSTGIITRMHTALADGAKGYLGPEDRVKMLQNLKSLREAFYATGDADYAGRNLFTGYRTNTRLSFQGKTKIPYEITEQLNLDAVDSFKYINVKDLPDINDSNFGSSTTTEQDITDGIINRIRLSYGSLDAGQIPDLKLKTGTDANGNNIYAPLNIGGNPLVIETYSKNDTVNNPYMLVQQNPNKAYFVPETGELLLGKNVSDAIAGLPKSQEVAVTYKKENWEKGDLRPEHYFACESNKGTPDAIFYNKEYLTNKKDDDIVNQIISYDVGFNQRLRVNTLAKESFTHNLGRDVDELLEVTKQVGDLEVVVEKLETMLKDNKYTDAQKKQIEEKLKAAKKAFDLTQAKCQKMFENGMTKMKGHLDQANLAMTNVGSRDASLEMVENRLRSQQTNFRELTDDNEGANMTQLIVQLESADMSFQAALMATGKIVQNSLVNFI